MKQLLGVIFLSTLCASCKVTPNKPIAVQNIKKAEIEVKRSAEDPKFEDLPLVEVTYFDAKTGMVVFQAQTLNNYFISVCYLYAEVEKIEVNLRKDSQRHTSLRVFRLSRNYGGFQSETFYLRDESSFGSKVSADYCREIIIEVFLQEDYQAWKDRLAKLKEQRDECRKKIEEEYNSYKKRVLPTK